MFKDYKRAVWRVPLHIALSLPFAALALPLPMMGRKYIAWRERSEQDDVTAGRDTPEKAAIDLYSQTALVDSVLKVWGK